MHELDSKVHKKEVRRHRARTQVAQQGQPQPDGLGSQLASLSLSDGGVAAPKTDGHGPAAGVATGGAAPSAPLKQAMWSVISDAEQASTLEALALLCHSDNELLRNRYRVSPYSTFELSQLRRCGKCNGKCLQRNGSARGHLSAAAAAAVLHSSFVYPSC
jgi:hypothetical protein